MFAENLRWGVTPGGFVKRSNGHGQRLVVREDCATEIDFSRCSESTSSAPPTHYHGRAPLRGFALSNGERALIRAYRHGGALRALTGSWFFTWPPRPFRELTITEELRRRGLRTAEIYAACVRVRGPFYRGWLVVKEISGSEDLWSALQSGLAARLGLESSMRAVAQSVRAMHGQGVYHGDLNLKNILLRAENDAVMSYLIDFDKAKLFLGKLPTELATHNLNRLRRSIQKLDPERQYFTAEAWEMFWDYYREAANG